jgi:hypothetical protein
MTARYSASKGLFEVEWSRSKVFHTRVQSGAALDVSSREIVNQTDHGLKAEDDEAETLFPADPNWVGALHICREHKNNSEELIALLIFHLASSSFGGSHFNNILCCTRIVSKMPSRYYIVVMTMQQIEAKQSNYDTARARLITTNTVHI